MWTFDDPNDPWAALPYLPDNYRLKPHHPPWVGPEELYDANGGRFGGALHLPDQNSYQGSAAGHNVGKGDASYLYWGDHQEFNVDRARSKSNATNATNGQLGVHSRSLDQTQ
jgi:hypothetical protein